MKILHLEKLILSIVLSAILFTNCDDKWDEHYNQDTLGNPEYNLNEYIAQTSELSIFNQLLKTTGYDKVLATSQSYTVWAPVNNALISIDTTDTDLARKIVRNHITRGSISSITDNQSVKMLNGKKIGYVYDGSNYIFGDNYVVSANNPTTNGLCNIIDGYAPALDNLWEFIGKNENLDSLEAFIYGQSDTTFDALNSTYLGKDSADQMIYDSSAWIYSNAVLENYGAINNEDSVYTALLPDNDAWDEAYSRISNYYNFPDDAGGAERQSNFTKFRLINDMLYEGRIDDPGSLTSITSTRGTTFSNPAEVFDNAYQTHDLSNGIAFITNQMPNIDTSWFKKIKVEAEEVDNRTNYNCLIYTRTSYGSGLDISKNKYILVDPTADEPYVEFSIPNTLSATYNIYCVFVPASIADASDTIPTKVIYELSWINRQSGSVVRRDITEDTLTSTNYTSLTKMWVTEYDFKFANVQDEDYDNVVVKLRVINDVSTEEEKNGDYSRTMRIDCIILEPVYE